MTPDERRTAQRERVQASVNQLLTKEGWAQWLEARKHFHSYSFQNQLLISHQLPSARYVAGFKTWLKLDRCVRKGSKGIVILVPNTVACRGCSKCEGPGSASEHKITIFRTAYVFDVSQVDPLPDRDPPPLQAPHERKAVDGFSHGILLHKLTPLADELGYTIESTTPGSDPILTRAEAYCDSTNKRIVINMATESNTRLRALIHELAHAQGVGYQEYGREAAEVLVDTVTMMVCDTIGLDVSGDSVPYIAEWGGENAAKDIEKFAKTIDRIATRLENALLDPETVAV